MEPSKGVFFFAVIFLRLYPKVQLSILAPGSLADLRGMFETLPPRVRRVSVSVKRAVARMAKHPCLIESMLLLAKVNGTEYAAITADGTGS